MMERVEGWVSPTAKENELVFLEDERGAGLGTRIGTN